LKKNIDNIIIILKYSDGELLELLIGFVRMFLFPYLVITSLFSIWWLLPVSIMAGVYQILATSKRDINCRHKANFVSFVASLLICFIVGKEYDSLFHYHFVFSFTIWLITIVNFSKTNYQIIKSLKGSTSRDDK
jgi:hypothetical protein